MKPFPNSDRNMLSVGDRDAFFTHGSLTAVVSDLIVLRVVFRTLDGILSPGNTRRSGQISREVWLNKEHAIQIQYKTILPASPHNVTWRHDDALHTHKQH